MSSQLVLNNLALEAAGRSLFDANLALARQRRTPDEVVRTLGDLGAQLERFVSGLDSACRTLGDSARARGATVSALIDASDRLDSGAGCDTGNGSAGDGGSA